MAIFPTFHREWKKKNSLDLLPVTQNMYPLPLNYRVHYRTILFFQPQPSIENHYGRFKQLCLHQLNAISGIRYSILPNLLYHSNSPEKQHMILSSRRLVYEKLAVEIEFFPYLQLHGQHHTVLENSFRSDKIPKLISIVKRNIKQINF